MKGGGSRSRISKGSTPGREGLLSDAKPRADFHPAQSFVGSACKQVAGRPVRGGEPMPGFDHSGNQVGRGIKKQRPSTFDMENRRVTASAANERQQIRVDGV